MATAAMSTTAAPLTALPTARTSPSERRTHHRRPHAARRAAARHTAPSNPAFGRQASRRMLSVLLRRMDGLDAATTTSLVAATNRPQARTPPRLGRPVRGRWVAVRTRTWDRPPAPLAGTAAGPCLLPRRAGGVATWRRAAIHWVA